MSLILALGRQKQANLYEFEATLIYRMSSRRIRAVMWALHIEGRQVILTSEPCYIVLCTVLTHLK